jgi:hypothetical protein
MRSIVQCHFPSRDRIETYLKAHIEVTDPFSQSRKIEQVTEIINALASEFGAESRHIRGIEPSVYLIMKEIVKIPEWDESQIVQCARIFTVALKACALF